MIRRVIGASAVLLLAGCSSWFGPLGLGLPAPVKLSAEDSGAEVRLKHSQQMVIRLPAAPGSGYAWAMREPPSGVVKPETAPRQETDAETWVFTPVREGSQQLRFEHRRSAQTDAPPAGVVSYTINVP